MLRFRIIKAKPGQPLPPPPDQQSPRRRDDREPQDTRVAARAAADAPAARTLPDGLGRTARARRPAEGEAAPAVEAPVAEPQTRRVARRL